jgi:hypothetical protein
MELRQASPLVEGPDTSELISLGGENADGDDRQNRAFHSSHLKRRSPPLSKSYLRNAFPHSNTDVALNLPFFLRKTNCKSPPLRGIPSICPFPVITTARPPVAMGIDLPLLLSLKSHSEHLWPP